MCYQDFKDTFVCNTQLVKVTFVDSESCVIRISKILLYAIHNTREYYFIKGYVVLSGFQRYFCMQYTTKRRVILYPLWLCYQDFKDTFVCNTQLLFVKKKGIAVVLSGFQRYFCMQYTTVLCAESLRFRLCYQDFKDTFVCNTQLVI